MTLLKVIVIDTLIYEAEMRLFQFNTKPNHPFYFVTKKLTHKIYFYWSYLPLWTLHTSVTLCSSQFQKYTKFKQLFYSRLDPKYYRMSIKDESFPRVEEILRNLCIPVWSSRFPLKCFGLKIILAQIQMTRFVLFWYNGEFQETAKIGLA